MKEEKIALRMVLPYVIVIVLFVIFLTISNIVMSFSDDGKFTFKNYLDIFKDQIFYKAIKNTAVWVFGSVLGQISLGLAVALLLNQIKRGQVFFRTIILILPWATLDIVAGVMWKWMYNDMYGVLNDLLMKAGIIRDYIAWLATPNMAMVSVIIANIWKGFCLCGMFFLAGIQTIPQELYEAAEIDGANAYRRFWNVTIPQLKPVMMTTLMLTIIWTINYFPLIYVMTGGGPNYGTETIVTYIYRLSFRFLEYNKSAALSNILFLLVFLIAYLFTRNMSKEVAA
ncbi:MULTISPECIES: carbohydrate ABC transporter permease [Pseudothermotoga]|uniref:Binding-protein-dependent transport systems inner membrane component n=1 Tax=Pseudothermotoga lettingae (strain ATCC BAA-301 / DSM 14385 / NBRC 107922 / TMO) TaxID=416591 RepID=A8F7X6_PSELT|nr:MULTISPECIES: sugar ABC transporter permease [Pseudothermotoga]ABV34260.1 binding-protein-dependent transport systems inner membrane component [Pseudothermotoga lettingae TMO]GLI48795.1 sugar ABC transporter permease [Pseudothermotoga lettingae TMO]